MPATGLGKLEKRANFRVDNTKTDLMMNKPQLTIGKKALLNLFSLYRGVQSKLHDLTVLAWECTLRCNLNCLHCGSDCSQKSSTKDMPIKDFLAVLDRVAVVYKPNKVFIGITGGEPLMREDLEECGKAFAERGYPWGMVTNGYLLTAERLDKSCASGMRSITVSLDGLTESHNWLRGNNLAYERAIAAIYLCAKKEDLKFDVVTCVHQKNFTELEQIKQLLIEKGVKNWRIFTIFAKGRAKSNELLELNAAQFCNLLEFIKLTRKEGKIELNFACEGFLGSYEGEVRDGLFSCNAGIDIASILADGSISACPSLRGDYIQGNIYQQDDFINVWHNRFQVMRDRRWTKTGPCADCQIFKWCQGNGLYLREEKTGRLLRCHYQLISEGQNAGG